MSDKPKLAMYWAASCGGCEIAVLNTHEKILDIDANLEVAFWPVAMDAKYHDVEAMPDGAITLTLFNGGMRSDENEEIARLLRRKSKILVAFGSCACEGCIPGLANLSSLSDLLDTAYATASTENPGGLRPMVRWSAPEGELRIPQLNPVLKPLAEVVPVDYYMPGCPPESHQIAAVVDVVIAALRGEGELPPPGTVLGTTASTVCEECVRTRNQKAVKRFVRIQEAHFDPELCLLEQGLPCNGPATRGGCGAKCPAAGAQCIGCYGPADGVEDYGAKLIAALGSAIDSNDPEEVERILDGIPDPAGQFYRFSLPGSLLRAGRAAWNGH